MTLHSRPEDGSAGGAPARGEPARGERGATLVEIMASLTIGVTVVVPLLAWMLLGLRTGADTEVVSGDARGRNLLGVYLSGDVAAAAAVVPGGTPCADDPDPGAEVLLTVAVGEGEPLAVYSVGTAPGDPHPSVWRRVCLAAGASSSATRLVDAVVAPAAGWPAAVACGARAGFVDDPCGTVELAFSTPQDHVVRAGATRRVEAPR